MLTHFFMRQRVIPRCIQNKYFNLIRNKLLERISFIKSRDSSDKDSNRTTKTFFNFTYKKYRFHFGIFTPVLIYSKTQTPVMFQALSSCHVIEKLVTFIKKFFSKIT